MDTAPFVDPGKQEIPFRGGVAAGTEDVTHPQTVATEVESVTETVVERVPETAVETPVVVKEPATDPVETPQVLTPSVNLPPPSDVVRTPPVETIPVRPPRPADDVTPETREPVAAPRPPSSFLRQIAHHEQVKYRYDPETGNVDARLVEPTEPVVTAWDRSSPAREQRDVLQAEARADPDSELLWSVPTARSDRAYNWGDSAIAPDAVGQMTAQGLQIPFYLEHELRARHPRGVIARLDPYESYYWSPEHKDDQPTTCSPTKPTPVPPYGAERARLRRPRSRSGLREHGPRWCRGSCSTPFRKPCGTVRRRCRGPLEWEASSC